ncbi:MAG: DMT family transporter [Rhodobacteraceae bacterium]|nr:DMT family transporter [Paracoccaceae bacterium]
MGNLRGIGLVVFSMAAFAVEDAIIKALTADLPVGEVLAALGLGGSLLFFLIAGDHGRSWLIRALRHPTVVIRTLCEGVSGATFVTALSTVPISTVAAVFQATPLAVTAGAALFMGEPVGWRRWAAVVAGFAGVLLIIRPGLAGFQPMALLVLVTVAAIAVRDLITRRVPEAVPSMVISFYGFFAVLVTGLAMLAFADAPRMPTAAQGALMAAAVLTGGAGYYAIVASMRLADASALMPFRYARLVFSLMIGVAVFGERPDAATLAGATIVILAAFYAYLRERRAGKSAGTAQ